MNDVVVNLKNDESGTIQIRDIHQTIIMENIDNNLSSSNKAWLKNPNKNNSIISYLKKNQSVILELSKHNLRFKNIFFNHTSVYFEDIYVPLEMNHESLHIQLNANKRKLNSNSYVIDDDFLIENIFKPTDGNKILNIIGGAGQGKSTVLSKIYLNQLKFGKLIPIYLAFRNIESNIISYLIQLFEDNKIVCNKTDVIGVLRSKQFCLILDAFDEISNVELRREIQDEIIRISRVYGTSVLCSSRPGTSLCLQSNVDNFVLNDLDNERTDKIIEKTLIAEAYDPTSVINVLSKNNGIKSSLKTPLLVVLFIKIFPKMDIIPDQAKDFYAAIFSLLHSGHDKYKDGRGIDRNLVTEYKRDDAQTIFSLFCYATFLKNQSSFTLEDANNILKTGVKAFSSQLNITENFDHTQFLQDVIECTSLLVLDGNENNQGYYSFLHKTIQEYHAALFFRDFIRQELDENIQNRFINKIVEWMFEDSSRVFEFIKFYSVIDINFSRRKFIYSFFNKYLFNENKPYEENIENGIAIFQEKCLINVEILISSELVKKYTPQHADSIFLEDRGNIIVSMPTSRSLTNMLSLIAENYDVQDKYESLFNEIIDKITNFNTTTIRPLTKTEHRKLDKGEKVERQIREDLSNLLKGDKDMNINVHNAVKELIIFIYDEIYTNLKMDIAISQQTVMEDQVFKNLFS